LKIPHPNAGTFSRYYVFCHRFRISKEKLKEKLKLANVVRPVPMANVLMTAIGIWFLGQT
jgi:hypothetical protein